MSLPAHLRIGNEEVLLRQARQEDVPAIVALIAADQLGASRDGIRSDADLAAYAEAGRPPNSRFYQAWAREHGAPSLAGLGLYLRWSKLVTKALRTLAEP